MRKNDLREKATMANRPTFPKRAIVTAGMPYGNKELHFGHIGGVFVYSDIYSRFLRDRLGKSNVIYVSGTDGYGSPIIESYEKLKENGSFSGSLQEFVESNHNKQKKVLDAYDISVSYNASCFGKANDIHQEVSTKIFQALRNNGHLSKITTKQFYDTEKDIFLNGRQVIGRCPILGCPADKAYADECSLGHQFMPHELENPKSTMTGKKPEMRDVTNWFLDLPKFGPLINKWSQNLLNGTKSRKFYVRNIDEFLEPPIIHVKRDQLEDYESIKEKLPTHVIHDNQTKAIRVEFKNLKAREEACPILTENNIRYRTGKTLVPFRLTANIDWGLPIPDEQNQDSLIWWVWPESLIAPISFTAAYLEDNGENRNDWTKWWQSPDTAIYQFIGEDNIYFYGVAQQAMFMGTQAKNLDDISAEPKSGQLQLSQLIVNNHLLFLNTKASSSGKVKPPLAAELLEHYTSDQLRTHFFALGLGIRSVGFKPKPFNPNATEKEADPVLKEGNLLCNVFNRIIRSCFYTAQKYFDGYLPNSLASVTIKEEADDVTLAFERLMFDQEFHLAIATLDKYIRSISKYWTQHSREADQNDDMKHREQMLVDTFQMVRTAALLMHPIAPEGTEAIRNYLQLDQDFWDWQKAFQPLSGLMNNDKHKLKFLEPRVDFFPKHHSQLPPKQ